MIIKCDNETEWLEKRRAAIGGSEAPAILQLDEAYGSPLGIWADKTGIAVEEDRTEAAQWLEIGREVEGPIGRLAAKYSERELIPLEPFTIVRSDETEFVACTPDFLVRDKERGLGVLQVKNVSGWNAHQWQEEPPARVLVQNQHELYACKTSREFAKEYGTPKYGMCAALLGGGKIVWSDQDANDRFMGGLLSKESAFWQLVVSQTPPEPMGKSACATAIKFLYPGDDGTVVELEDPKLLKMIDEYDALTANSKLVKTRIDILKQTISISMGEAARATLPDGTGFSLLTTPEKRIEPKPYTKKAFRTLRRTGLKKKG